MCHWLLQCSAWNFLWQPLQEAMGNVGEDNGDRTALILSHACRNYHTCTRTLSHLHLYNALKIMNLNLKFDLNL